MASYTFTKAGREFRVDGPQQLGELVRDRLLSVDDEVQPDDASAPVRVGDLLGEPAGRSSGSGSADPWDAWDDDEDEGAADLVEQMLSGQRQGVGTPSPVEESNRSSRYLLRGGGARREDLSAAPEPPAPVDDAPPVRIPPPDEPSGPASAVETPEELPASFVEFVQQKRAVVSPLEIHEDPENQLATQPRRKRIPGLVPIVAGVLGLLTAAAVYSVVRAGAQRTYPTEAEVRGRALEGETDATATEATPEEPTEVPLSPEMREIRIRESIPVAVRPFRDVEGLQDVLFTDLTNADVRVRAVRIGALVLKPDAAGIPTRPEEIHLEIDLATEDGPALEDSLLRAAMVLGHYGSDAHLRIQDVVLRADVGAEDALCYRVRGPALVALYERETPMAGFIAGLETVLPSFTVVPTVEVPPDEDPR